MSHYLFLFSFNKSVSRTLCGSVRSRRKLFVKGDRKKKVFLFFVCSPLSRKGQTRYKLWVQFSTAVCQMQAYFQQPFTHLSLLLSSCLLCSLFLFISILLFYSQTISVIFSGLPHLFILSDSPDSLFLGSEDSLVALMLLFQEST